MAPGKQAPSRGEKAPSTARVAVVTGANKGIGREIARQLAEGGHVVHLGARDPGRGHAAERELRAEGLDVRFLHLGVTDENSVALAAKRVEDETGPLHVLVNNAGIGVPEQAPSQTSAEQVRRVVPRRGWRRRTGPAGRGRPGPDVRLRDGRDADADAARACCSPTSTRRRCSRNAPAGHASRSWSGPVPGSSHAAPPRTRW
jgi:hypothetical protein